MTVLLLTVIGLAADYPVASKDNCTVAQRFITKPGSAFVNECVKFGRGNYAKLLECNIGNKLVAFGGSGDDVAADSKTGFRYACTQDAQDVHIGVVACVIKGKVIAIGSTGKVTDENHDFGYLFACKKDLKDSVGATREGCYLAPDTSDELFLQVDQVKHVPQIGQYCKCAYKGFGVACSITQDSIKSL